MTIRKIASILCFLLVIINAQAQDYYDENYLRYDDYCYDENIKSVLLYKDGFELSMPYLKLNSDEKLRLSFDDLLARGNEYQYTVELCDANWEASELMQMEYLEGMYTEYFGDAESSINTKTSYMHYETTVPSQDMTITKSGNYLLKVFIADEPDNIVITRRFYIYETGLKVMAEAKLPRTAESLIAQHELNVNLDITSYPIENVYGDLKVYVQQNGRKDNIKILTEPKSISGNTIKYNIVRDILFEAGNEYRGLDIRSLKLPTPQIVKTYEDSNGLNINLMKDMNRSRTNYLTYKDLNGQYQIINRDPIIRSSHIEADYAWVHFSLPAKYPQSEGAVYIMGALSDWRFNESNKMMYNYDRQSYEGKLFLKQGFYNYVYAYLPNGKEEAELKQFEGSHGNTQNTYTIYVYYRPGGEQYDRIIAIETIETEF